MFDACASYGEANLTLRRAVIDDLSLKLRTLTVKELYLVAKTDNGFRLTRGTPLAAT